MATDGGIAAGAGAAPQGRSLTVVYQSNDFQLTGVTMSKSGRLFVNFPRWPDQYLNAVVEVMNDGTAKPFPDEYWKRWDKKPWILDPAAPLLSSVVPGGIVIVDLASGKAHRALEGHASVMAQPGVGITTDGNPPTAAHPDQAAAAVEKVAQNSPWTGCGWMRRQPLHHGKSVRKEPYAVFRFKL